MKYVAFVSGLVVEKVPHFGKDDVDYFTSAHPMRLDDGSGLGMSSKYLPAKRTVPIFEMFGVGKIDAYVAYSEEVETLLGIPIRALVAERDMHKHQSSRYFEEKRQEYAERLRLHARLRRLQEWTVWRRILFVFNRALPK